MRNIQLNSNGQGVTLHTPHGQVVVRVYGSPGHDMNETRITILGNIDGEHIQADHLNTPVVFPEKDSNIYSVRLRHRGSIKVKEMGTVESPTPLSAVAEAYLKDRKQTISRRK